jgi:hypothetical protein
MKNYFAFAADELGIKADLLPYMLAEIRVKASSFLIFKSKLIFNENDQVVLFKVKI